MGKITVVSANGDRTEIEGVEGESLMRLALNNSIEGLAAECGGCLSCATCHVYVAEDWVDRVPTPTEEEMVMVECAIDARASSRLSCQIVYTKELDGIEIEIPESQY